VDPSAGLTSIQLLQEILTSVYSRAFDRNKGGHHVTVLHIAQSFKQVVIQMNVAISEHIFRGKGYMFRLKMIGLIRSNYKNIKGVFLQLCFMYKAWVYGRSLAGIAGSNPAGCMDVCLLCVLCVVR
jgi:hypothetical protein